MWQCRGRGHGPVWVGEGSAVHWQRYPCRGSRSALVRTVLGGWGPQGAAKHTEEALQLCRGGAPSRSRAEVGGDRCSGRQQGCSWDPAPHLVVLLKHPLHKLVTSVVGLRCCSQRAHGACGHRGWGCAQLMGTAGHFLPTQAIHTASSPTQRKTTPRAPNAGGPGAPCPIQQRAKASPEPEIPSRWAEVVRCQLQQSP